MIDNFQAWPYLDSLYDYQGLFKQFNNLGTIPEEKIGTKVAIIGAGASGMVAAYELLKVGLLPVIFEASARIGGRLYSKTFTEIDGSQSSAFAEMGAMRIPHSSRLFFYYADRFKIDYSQDFPNPGKVPTLLCYEGKSFLWQPNYPLPKDFQKLEHDWKTYLNILLERFYEPWCQGDLQEVKNLWQRYLNRFKRMNFAEVLFNILPWSDRDIKRFGELGIGTGGFSPFFHLSWLEFMRIVINQCETNQKLITQGVTQLIRQFYTDITETPRGKLNLATGGKLLLNTQVHSIEKVPEKGLVKIVSGDKHNVDFFPAAIVATTTRSMEIMGLTFHQDTMPLQNNEIEAIRNIHHVGSSKLFIRTETKFWLDGNGNVLKNFPVVVLTDELPKNLYLLNYPQTDCGVVCVSYTWENDSHKLIGIPPKERFSLFKKIFTRVHPELGEALIPVNNEIICIDWQMTPFYYEAFKLCTPGQEESNRVLYYQFQSCLNSQTDPGVYLAGDSISWSGGWVEGALSTGINAACAVIYRLGGKLPKTSPLSINPHLFSY